MLNLIHEKRFSKDLKLCEKQDKNMAELEDIIELLVNNKPLPRNKRNHQLKGKFSDFWECHIQNDWLLIYKKTEFELILVRTGSHSHLRLA